jgi:diguanylate cyclase (GGDEF)-like protein
MWNGTQYTSDVPRPQTDRPAPPEGASASPGVPRLDTPSFPAPPHPIATEPPECVEDPLASSGDVSSPAEGPALDPLTHVFNRSYFNGRLVAEVAHALHTNGNAAVLMVDVDDLKQVNDRFGHLAGDRALCAVATRILRVIRVKDVLTRYDSEHFVILARATDGAEAARLAERVRGAVEALHMGARGQNIRITLSIGVASLAELKPADEPVPALLALADRRMDRAKESGRNQVCA